MAFGHPDPCLFQGFPLVSLLRHSYALRLHSAGAYLGPHERLLNETRFALLQNLLQRALFFSTLSRTISYKDDFEGFENYLARPK